MNQKDSWNSIANISFRVCGVGIGLLSSKPSEVVYASVARVAAITILKQEEVKFEISVGWLQVDDATPLAHFPTILRPITESFVVRKSNRTVTPLYTENL